MPMKILYHHRIASKDGQYVHIEEIINALRSLHHDVIVVAPELTKNAEFGNDGGWVSKLRANLPKQITELLEFFYSFIVFYKLCKAIIKHKPDMIYERYNLFLPAGIWAKKIFKLKLLLEVNSPLYYERNCYGGIALHRLAKWSEKYTWLNADHVLPVTEVLAGYIRKAGVSPTKITVLHNGIDVEHFYPASIDSRDLRFSNKLVIGFVGFCREWHKLDEVLDMIANENNPNLILLVVGDGPVINDLKAQAAMLNISDKLHTTGLVSRKDMPYWLDQIDVAIQPAVTPWCSPLKLIEYLGKGKAIVAPDSENIKELLEDKDNALLFDNTDTLDMIVKIQTIIKDEKLRSHIQERAFETIKERNLTWKQNAKAICDII